MYLKLFGGSCPRRNTYRTAQYLLSSRVSPILGLPTPFPEFPPSNLTRPIFGSSRGERNSCSAQRTAENQTARIEGRKIYSADNRERRANQGTYKLFHPTANGVNGENQRVRTAGITTSSFELSICCVPKVERSSETTKLHSAIYKFGVRRRFEVAGVDVTNR